MFGCFLYVHMCNVLRVEYFKKCKMLSDVRLYVSVFIAVVIVVYVECVYGVCVLCMCMCVWCVYMCVYVVVVCVCVCVCMWCVSMRCIQVCVHLCGMCVYMYSCDAPLLAQNHFHFKLCIFNDTFTFFFCSHYYI